MKVHPDWFSQDVLNCSAYYAARGEERLDLFLERLRATTDAIADNPELGSKKYSSEVRVVGLRHRDFHVGSTQFLTFYTLAEDGVFMRRLVGATSDIRRKLSVLAD